MYFKTETEILLSMIQKAQEVQLISEKDDLVERISNGEQTENQYVLDLGTHAYINSDLVEDMSDIYDGTDIATARGDQLDDFGHLFNVERHMGRAAQVSLQLSLPVAESTDIIIPAGTVVYIDELQVDPYITYTTDENITIRAGSTTASVTASSDYFTLQRRVPADCVRGLEGFPGVIATNTYAGTEGSSIEEDDDYRQRILLWSTINTRGTKDAFDEYLGKVEGLDDYKLIPRPQGVGTLTVVCDCIEDRLYDIREGIQDKCMLLTDEVVQCVLPSTDVLDVDIHATLTSDPITNTMSEITELLRHETEVFLAGGDTRTGQTVQGLRIAESFVPSRLVMHLHNMFPEIVSLDCVTPETSPTSQYHKIKPGLITVVVE